MKKLTKTYFDPYIVRLARLIAACLIIAGCIFYWKFDIGLSQEEKSAAFMFGALPIIYGGAIALVSIKPDKDKRIQILRSMVGVPIIFASASFAAALIVTALK